MEWKIGRLRLIPRSNLSFSFFRNEQAGRKSRSLFTSGPFSSLRDYALSTLSIGRADFNPQTSPCSSNHMELSIYVLFRFEHEHEQDLDHFQTRSNWTRRQNQTSTPPPSRTGYRQMSTRMDSTARRKRTKQLKLPEPLPVEPWSSSWSLSFWSFVQSKLKLDFNSWGIDFPVEIRRISPIDQPSIQIRNWLFCFVFLAC